MKARLTAVAKTVPQTFGIATSPFGSCLVADSPQGICFLSFFEPGGEIPAVEELRSLWPGAAIFSDDTRAAQQIGEIFSPADAEKPSIPVCVHGTDFQLRVWRALLAIPFGTTTTYAQIAANAGNPRACRAAGSAVGANPVSFLIPCHRVIRSDGTSGQYRWGSSRKKIMLDWEKAALAAP